MKIALLPLARSTFDVAYAQEKFEHALCALKKTSHHLMGADRLLFEAEETQAVLEQLKTTPFDLLLVLQVTFTDASIVVEAGNIFNQPLAIWAIPEPRVGGRLRLNAFCGLNLASHALGRRQRAFGYLYTEPNTDNIEQDLNALFAGDYQTQRISAQVPSQEHVAQGRKLHDALGSLKIGRIGEHPAGFDTCDYDKEKFEHDFPVKVEQVELNDFFDIARSLPNELVASIRSQAEQDLGSVAAVNQDELDKSLRLKGALDVLQKDNCFDAFAIRCWPETFTEYGGAVCGPMSMMAEAKVPCACEADVYGALSQLLLAKAAQQPVFMADMVDIDVNDNTAVIWHCGQAPISMADLNVRAEATIHTNRKMPLLYEFPLKAGKVTFARLSRAHSQLKLVLAEGEMLARDKAFTGTSGVVRFKRPAREMMQSIINSGLEHHMVIAYGSHTHLLEGFAAAIDLPVLYLS